jgi:uncharacterized membrane protein YdbT with pleckstrin-like domain
MADERIIFKGNPSVVAIFGTLVLSVILFVVLSAGLIYYWKEFPQGTLRHVLFWVPLIPLLVFLCKWIALSFTAYEITSERVKVIKGILSKRTDELELYRVKDTSLVEPFIYRMFSAGNIVIVTGDATTPQFELKAIKNAKEVREQLRASIEECRTRKRAGIVELE